MQNRDEGLFKSGLTSKNDRYFELEKGELADELEQGSNSAAARSFLELNYLKGRREEMDSHESEQFGCYVVRDFDQVS